MVEEWLDRLRELWEEPWSPLGTPAFLALSAAMILVVLLYLGSGEGWTPFVDGINLVFHEAGHPLFGIFGDTVGALGGTLMQLLVPAVVAVTFWARRHPASAAFGGAWFFQNFWNISRYIADARAQVLPLVGGGEHDWAALLGHWGLLGADTTIARAMLVAGWLGFLGCWAWAFWRWRRRT